MNPVGRPPRRGKKRAQIILAALEEGNSYRAAAGLAGISEDTLRRWMKDSASFAVKVDAARAHAEADAVRKMHLDPLGWRFALERQYGWHEQKRLEIENLAGLRIVDDEAPGDLASTPAPETG
ncbi:MAG TPA: helix-turn-helix domain-containing protein [Candidatus Acidoferrales bacterium]|nr:helix-turn-helix domain-containing protein [Anaerolineales bacterium]HLE35664.1 helix-turn-helix domain-containing protein [Candidatus Acidoferrales bacterium]